MDQLNEKKRKSEETAEAPKEKKQKKLTAWSATELDKDESKNLEHALKEVLKDGVSCENTCNSETLN